MFVINLILSLNIPEWDDERIQAKDRCTIMHR